MTDDFDPTQRTREPFDDATTGDQGLPGDSGTRERDADAGVTPGTDTGMTSGLPGDLFGKPDPDQPAEGGREEAEDASRQSELGREADADSQTLNR
jgi:hypothetical protein